MLLHLRLGLFVICVAVADPPSLLLMLSLSRPLFSVNFPLLATIFGLLFAVICRLCLWLILVFASCDASVLAVSDFIFLLAAHTPVSVFSYNLPLWQNSRVYIAHQSLTAITVYALSSHSLSRAIVAQKLFSEHTHCLVLALTLLLNNG